MPTDPFDGINGEDDLSDVEKQPKKKTISKKKNSNSKTPPTLPKAAEPVEAPTLLAEPLIQINNPQAKANDTKEKANLIFSVKAYLNNPRFGKYLKEQGKNYSDSRLNSMRIEELQLELESLDLTLANRGSQDFIDQMIKNGLLVAERTVHDRTELKVAGTTSELWQNDKFLDLLERAKLKYGLPSVQLDPALELALIVAQTAMMVHHRNTVISDLKNSVDLDVPVKKHVEILLDNDLPKDKNEESKKSVKKSLKLLKNTD